MSNPFIQLLQATTKVELVPVKTPKWGTIFMRQMMASDLEDEAKEPAAKGGVPAKGTPTTRSMARGLARTMCDKDGKLLLDANNPEHIDLLLDQPWALLQKLVNVAGKLNGAEEAKNE